MEALVYKASSYEALNTIGYYYQYVFNRKLTLTPHSHNFYEILYMLNGSCLQRINDTDLTFSKGEIIFLRPGDIHCFKGQSDDCVMISLSVTKSEILKFSNIYTGLSKLMGISSRYEKIAIDKREKGLIDSLVVSTNTVSDQEKRNELIKILLSFIIQLLILKRQIISPVTGNEKKQHALDLLMLQMSDPENIKEGVDAMIRLTNYSRPHLYRIFKEHYNTTPKQYAKNIQMDYAYQLVSSSKLTFEQIAEKIGYSSLSHFQKAFKEAFGKTASKVRKETTENTI